MRFEGDLRPRAFDTTHFGALGTTPWDACRLLHNAHVKIRLWEMAESMQELVRNADGDELLFIHSGSGHLFCDYGHLEFREGDIVDLGAEAEILKKQGAYYSFGETRLGRCPVILCRGPGGRHGCASSAAPGRKPGLNHIKTKIPPYQG